MTTDITESEMQRRQEQSERDRAAHQEAEKARREAERYALLQEVEERLSNPIPEGLRPVGLVSAKRAQYLMMAPAVAGGWIAVEHGTEHPRPGSYWPIACFPACDIELGDGDPVCDVRRGMDAAEMARELRGEARKWARKGYRPLVEDALGLLDLVEREG